MKQIKQELRRRDIVFDESDKAPELKAKLMKSLKGKNIKIQITFVMSLIALYEACLRK